MVRSKKRRIDLRFWIPGLLVLIMGSCVSPVPREDRGEREPLFFRETRLRGPLEDDAPRESLLASVEKSLAYLEKRGEGGGDADGGGKVSPRQVYRTLRLFREILAAAPDKAEWDRMVRKKFGVYELAGPRSSPSVLLTGYFEPVLEGSLTAGGPYQYPLYARPGDLLERKGRVDFGATEEGRQMVRREGGRAVPYYSRREIDSEGVLGGRGLEMVWLRDPWERFVLHVQGSGRVRLPDGSAIRVGYAASNGRPYRAIGRHLVDRGLLGEKELSLERVRQFLQENPGRAEEIFNFNERYIFFRALADSEGPVGALGVPLTPGRSIATDLSLFPPGALGYLVSRQPELDGSGRLAGWKPLRRFVVNQDAGGAIVGPGRVDLFFGSGGRAGMAAGVMKEEGKLYILLAG